MAIPHDRRPRAGRARTLVSVLSPSVVLGCPSRQESTHGKARSGRRCEPTGRARSSPPVLALTGRLITDDVVPTFVEEPAVSENALFIALGEPPRNRRAAQMGVRTDALVPVRRDFPACLTNAKTEIRLVPFSRNEGLVEIADCFETRFPDYPRPDDSVDLFEAEPVERRRTDRALEAPSVNQVTPRFDRFIQRTTIETAAQAQKPEFLVLLKGCDELTHEPSPTHEHVVLPGQDQVRSSGAESSIRATEFVQIAFVKTPQVPLAPFRARDVFEVLRRRVATSVFDDDDLDVLVRSDASPAFQTSRQDREVVERRNDDRESRYGIGRGCHFQFPEHSARCRWAMVWVRSKRSA